MQCYNRYDIRGHFILGGNKAHDYSTICCLDNTLVSHSTDLLTEFVKLLFEDGHVDLKTLYIDGTKIESVANRYTFVWIQAEDAFSKLKVGMKYNRFRHRSMEKVVSDLVLVALGLNITRLHSKMLNNQTEIISYKKTA